MRSGMVPFERALVSLYRPSIVTFPLSLRVSDILPLLFSSMPLFPYPTSSLPKISPCSLGVGGSPSGYKERRCWANCPCNQFPRFPTYVITNHQRYRQTTCDPIPRICTKVHCAVKIQLTSWQCSKILLTLLTACVLLTNYVFMYFTNFCNASRSGAEQGGHNNCHLLTTYLLTGVFQSKLNKYMNIQFFSAQTTNND